MRNMPTCSPWYARAGGQALMACMGLRHLSAAHTLPTSSWRGVSRTRLAAMCPSWHVARHALESSSGIRGSCRERCWLPLPWCCDQQLQV